MTPTSVIGYLFAAAVTVSCVQYLRSGGLKEDLSVFHHRSWKDWTEMSLGAIVCIAFLYFVYFWSQRGPAFLNFSWMQLLATKGEKVHGTNQMLAGASIPYFGILFVALLIPNLPRLAAAEEEEFRLGTKNWLHAIPRSLAFGLMHMIVGVPLWLGLALSIPGMWFTGQYFKGGVSRSTMAHALYNLLLAAFLFLLVIDFNLPHAAKPR